MDVVQKNKFHDDSPGAVDEDEDEELRKMEEEIRRMEQEVQL